MPQPRTGIQALPAVLFVLLCLFGTVRPLAAQWPDDPQRAYIAQQEDSVLNATAYTRAKYLTNLAGAWRLHDAQKSLDYGLQAAQAAKPDDAASKLWAQYYVVWGRYKTGALDEKKAYLALKQQVEPARNSRLDSLEMLITYSSSVVLRQAGEIDKSIVLLDQALAIARKQGWHKLQLAIAPEIISLLQAKGMLGKLPKYFKILIRAAELLNDVSTLLEYYPQLAENYAQSGQLQLAHDTWYKAYMLALRNDLKSDAQRYRKQAEATAEKMKQKGQPLDSTLRLAQDSLLQAEQDSVAMDAKELALKKEQQRIESMLEDARRRGDVEAVARLSGKLQEMESKRKALLEEKKAQTIYIALSATALLFALVALAVVFRSARERAKRNAELAQRNKHIKSQNKLLEQQKQELQAQKAETELAQRRSDELLLNILPQQIAEELKGNADNRVQTRSYPLSSILFLDIVGFTSSAEKMSPEEVVSELDRIFATFDRIVERYNLEKIKTIGDAYMAAGGLPIPNKTNPIDCILAGLEMMNYMQESQGSMARRGFDPWQLRAGVHSGPVVAGIVGTKKFAYDIWGDTVNTASRMESNSEPGKLNISGETYEHVKDFFACTFRGHLPVKNKGEIAMYFVDGILPELSRNGQGLKPNERFEQLHGSLNFQ